MEQKKNIALVAHDSQKAQLLSWVEKHIETISKHNLTATGTTGRLIQDMFDKKFPHMTVNVNCLKSGPLGGDLQLGSLIADGKVDVLIFLTDPMTPQPHDVDIKALIRVAVIYNIIIACTRSTAEFVVKSPLFNTDYKIEQQDFHTYADRKL